MTPQLIGITDFENQEQVKTVLSHRDVDAKHLLHVGLMLYSQTRDGMPPPSKWLLTFRTRVAMREIFLADPRVFNVVHYANYDRTRMQDYFSQLEFALEYGGSNVHAIQLDSVWPPHEAIRRFKARYQSIKIILQVGHAALLVFNGDAKSIAKRIFDYRDCVDYVLFDASAGRTTLIDVPTMLQVIEATKQCLGSQFFGLHDSVIGTIVAGGLSAETLDVLRPLLLQVPNLSIDAEGKLHGEAPSESGLIFGGLDMKRVVAYYVAAQKLLGEGKC